MRAKYVLIAIFLFFYNNLFAQKKNISWTNYLEQFLIEDNLSSDEIEYLYSVFNHPIDINNSTKNELERIPFLSPQQVEEILAYIYLNGDLKSKAELNLINKLDYYTIDKIKDLIIIKPIKNIIKFTINNFFKYGKSNLSNLFSLPLIKSKGYLLNPNFKSQNKYYLGPNWSTSFRYKFNYTNTIKVGFTGDKDKGENFFYKNNGYDFYSYYISLSNLYFVNKFILGKYKINFGQGLIISQNIFNNRILPFNIFKIIPQGIREHSSIDEYDYFNGVATSLKLNSKLDFSLFWSRRKMDGTIKNDVIESIKSDGLHNTSTLLSHKDDFHISTYGGNLVFHNKDIRMQINTILYSFSLPYFRPKRDYNKYYFRGNFGSNYSLSYSYANRKLSLDGEIALSNNLKFAILNIFRYKFSERYILIILHRYYNKSYQAFYANSFSEGGKTQNEHGLYFCFRTFLLKKWCFDNYLDFFYFPYLKYQVNSPSKGIRWTSSATYNINRANKMFFRYILCEKAKNYKTKKYTQVIPYVQHKFKYEYLYSPSDSFSLKTLFNFNCSYFSTDDLSLGFGLSGYLNYRFAVIPLSLSFQTSFFKTDDYSSRIYIYERGPLFTFNFPALYGEGMHNSLCLTYKINKSFSILCHLNQFIYKNKESIGTGLNEIPRNQKYTLNLQTRIRF